MTRTTTAPNLDSGFISRSHRAIAAFNLHRPDTILEAAALLANGAIAHAGGIDVVSSLRLGAGADDVVDLGRLSELNRLEVTDTHLMIGAGSKHATIESDALIRSVRPDLARAWQTVGNVRIRRTGSVGGNLMAFRPDYDAASILAAADATLVFLAADGSELRTNVADRPKSGLLVRCEIPLSGHVVFDRSLKPVVTVAVGDNTIAIGCAHHEPVVVGRHVVFDVPDPIDDANASREYRTRMIHLLTERGIERHREVTRG